MLQKLCSLGQRLFGVLGGDLNSAGIHEFRQLDDLKASIGQHGQKVITVVCVCVLRFTGVEQLGGASQCQLESRLG